MYYIFAMWYGEEIAHEFVPENFESVEEMFSDMNHVLESLESYKCNPTIYLEEEV